MFSNVVGEVCDLTCLGGILKRVSPPLPYSDCVSNQGDKGRSLVTAGRRGAVGNIPGEVDGVIEGKF